jgi:hypothetical protein
MLQRVVLQRSTLLLFFLKKKKKKRSTLLRERPSCSWTSIAGHSPRGNQPTTSSVSTSSCQLRPSLTIPLRRRPLDPAASSVPPTSTTLMESPLFPRPTAADSATDSSAAVASSSVRRRHWYQRVERGRKTTIQLGRVFGPCWDVRLD